VKNISSMVHRIRNKRENRDEENARTNPFDGVLNCFLFAWFIAGLKRPSFLVHLLAYIRSYRYTVNRHLACDCLFVV